MRPSLIAASRKAFHRNLVSKVLSVDSEEIPSNADRSSQLSVGIARALAQELGATHAIARPKGQTSGNQFESVVEDFLSETFLQLSHLRPGKWMVTKVGSRSRAALIAQFEQYQHLFELEALAKSSPTLAAALGSDYFISPDVVIARYPEPDDVINAKRRVVDEGVARRTPLRAINMSLPVLHASISCKWTLRSDRAQNAKSEALNLIRNRKGPLPHTVAITGEPLPSRISSLALGTGDLDCVYHFALNELIEAVQSEGDETSKDLLQVMISGKRLKDVSDLPLDLCL